MIREYGYEADELGGRASGMPIRWWLYVHLEPGEGRNQRARQGVADQGFYFARGGRSGTPEEAQEALGDAMAEARVEAQRWRHQPSHALGPSGELVPLGPSLRVTGPVEELGGRYVAVGTGLPALDTHVWDEDREQWRTVDAPTEGT